MYKHINNMDDIKEIAYTGFHDDFILNPGAIVVENNCLINDLNTVINIFDDKLIDQIERLMPTLVNDGINNASNGVIQDPAGTAIGSQFLFGGGASGAIYSTFELEPIPHIQKCAAIFNSTEDSDGKRILHTHSPILKGDPEVFEDVMKVIKQLTDSYLNTIIAFLLHRSKLGKHGKILNLVPISGSIFAGNFRQSEIDHLDPSFTLVSIALAIGLLLKKGFPIPTTTLYFYDNDVYERAKNYIKQQ